MAATKKPKKKKLYSNTKAFLWLKPDFQFLIVILLINIFGLVMIYSASYYYAISAYRYESDHFFTNQLFYVVVGLAAMMLLSYVRTKFYKKFIMASVFIMFILLILVRIPGIGQESHGAYRWIGYKNIRVQIAEPVKICVILFFAGIISRTNLKQPITVWLLLGIDAAASLLLLFLSNNMSTAIIVFLMGYLMLTIAMKKPKWFVIALAAAFLLAVVAVILIQYVIPYSDAENFRITRIRAWLNPTDPRYASDTAYQPTQALYAIASGGFFGKGLGQSLIKFKLPEPHNDYILAIIFEELGIFGVIILTYLFAYLLYKIFMVFVQCRERFSRYLVLGVFLHLTIQILLNYTVTLGLLPTMGVTLPFISAGGSSAAFSLVELGVVMAVEKQNREAKYYQESFDEIRAEDPEYKRLMEEKDALKKKAQAAAEAGKETK